MRKRAYVLSSVALLSGIAFACGGSGARSGFDPNTAKDGGSEAAPGLSGSATCTGLECTIDKCTGKDKTTLKGKVYDPAGANPLYNVMVYIPKADDPDNIELPPMKDSTQEPDGIACETCASVVVNPLRIALTDENGEFVLEDVPTGPSIPLVVQVGKWRRLLRVDVSKSCEENKAKDKSIRLPKNSAEGNLPQIAVTTGALDALECLLRGIGIDEKEFVMGNDDSGHVHVFMGSGGGMGTPAADFWNDGAQLRKYDLVLLSCEGATYEENKGGYAADARGSMYDYLNAGGKVFATHFHYVWFKGSPSDEFKNIAQWGSGGVSLSYDVNQSFPKGEKFAKWLKAIGASSTLGKIDLEDETSSVVSANDPALSWITGPGTVPKYFSFNTPLSNPDGTPTAVENQCGRAVFSDLHMVKYQQAHPNSIQECAIGPGGLSDQQKALEFLFFDLSACVTDDKATPSPPR